MILENQYGVRVTNPKRGSMIDPLQAPMYPNRQATIEDLHRPPMLQRCGRINLDGPTVGKLLEGICTRHTLVGSEIKGMARQ